MDFLVDPRVETYLRSLDRTADPVLKEMEELARERDFPIVGAHAGKLLGILTRATGPGVCWSWARASAIRLGGSPAACRPAGG